MIAKPDTALQGVLRQSKIGFKEVEFKEVVLKMAVLKVL